MILMTPNRLVFSCLLLLAVAIVNADDSEAPSLGPSSSHTPTVTPSLAPSLAPSDAPTVVRPIIVAPPSACECTVAPAQFRTSTTLSLEGVAPITVEITTNFESSGSIYQTASSTSADAVCSGWIRSVSDNGLPVVQDDCKVLFPLYTETSCSVQCSSADGVSFTLPCTALFDSSTTNPASVAQFSTDCQCFNSDSSRIPAGVTISPTCRTGVIIDDEAEEADPKDPDEEEEEDPEEEEEEDIAGDNPELTAEAQLDEWLDGLLDEVYGENQEVQDTLDTLEALEIPTDELTKILETSKDAEVQQVLREGFVSSLLLEDPLDPDSGQASPQVIADRIAQLQQQEGAEQHEVEVVPTPQNCEELNACGIVVEDRSMLEVLACSLPYIDGLCGPLSVLKDQQRQRDEITRRMLEAVSEDGNIDDLRKEQRKLVEEGIPKIMGAAKDIIVELANAIAAIAGGTLLKVKEQIEKNIETAKKIETITDGEFNEDDEELIMEVIDKTFDDTVEAVADEETKEDLGFLDKIDKVITDVTSSEFFQAVTGWSDEDDDRRRVARHRKQRQLVQTVPSLVGLPDTLGLKWIAPAEGGATQSKRYRFLLNENRTRVLLNVTLGINNAVDRCLSIFVIPLNEASMSGSEMVGRVKPAPFYSLAAFSARGSMQLLASDFVSGRHLLPAILGQNGRAKLCVAPSGAGGDSMEELAIHFAPVRANVVHAGEAFELNIVAHDAGVPVKAIFDYMAATNTYIQSLADPTTGEYTTDLELQKVVNEATALIEEYQPDGSGGPQDLEEEGQGLGGAQDLEEGHGLGGAQDLGEEGQQAGLGGTQDFEEGLEQRGEGRESEVSQGMCRSLFLSIYPLVATFVLMKQV